MSKFRVVDHTGTESSVYMATPDGEEQYCFCDNEDEDGVASVRANTIATLLNKAEAESTKKDATGRLTALEAKKMAERGPEPRPEVVEKLLDAVLGAVNLACQQKRMSIGKADIPPPRTTVHPAEWQAVYDTLRDDLGYTVTATHICW